MLGKPIEMWLLFIAIILLLLLLDLGIFHKNQHEIGVKESLLMSGFYILIALLFGLWVLYQLGGQAFSEYLTGFLVEKSLALDNIFVFSLIFSGLAIPMKYQHRVLFWGILGVIVLRAIMIGLGAQLINEFSWILYIFAAFMIITGIKMFFIPKIKLDVENSFLLKWMRKHLRLTDLHGTAFLVRKLDPKSGSKFTYITPLFVALIFIEFIDLVFAVDSVPAIFTITKDPYIVYTSNIFAILGLRALYFAIASILDRFYYLKFSLALVLIFIGAKVFIADMFDLVKIPAYISLGVTFGLLAFGCLYSIYKSRP